MLIIDMPMPRNCAECELQTWDSLDGHYICAKTQNNIDGCVYEEKMKNDCPLFFNIDEIEPLSISACNDKVALKLTGVSVMKGAERMKCGYYDRPRTSFPCNKCEYNGKDCLTAKGREPLTCWHCRLWSGEVKPVCHHRKGTSIRPCEHFELD